MISVLPLVLTFSIALVTRRVLMAMLMGVLSGVFLIYVWSGSVHSADLVQASMALMSKAANIQILVLILLISGFVKLLESTQATHSLNQLLTHYIQSKTQLSIITWLSGLALFFTDSGNSLLLGPVFRGLYDERKLCREKLAYILDATSSPVCILIPFIGWGVYISGLIEQSLPASLSEGQQGMPYLLAAFPYQFYAIFTLLALPLFIKQGLNFSLMGKAQKSYELNYLNNNTPVSHVSTNQGLPLRFVIYPLLVLTIGTLSLLLGERLYYQQFDFSLIKINLIIAYSIASLTLFHMLNNPGIMLKRQILGHFITGMKSISHICLILILAWHLSLICRLLGTDFYIASLIKHLSIIGIIPVCLFLIGALISLATGSSWGTFSILLPIAIPMAFQLEMNISMVIAAVLSGGLFGDHCSPLSDTTILSSMGAGCEPSAHIKTQIPYALIVAGLTLIAYLLCGMLY